MADEIDVAQLMVKLEADNTALRKSFEKGASDINTSLERIEARVGKFQTGIESKFAQIGTNAARRLTGALAAGLSFEAIERFVSSVSSSAETVKKQAAALGLSTDKYQELSLSAKRAGIDQDSFNSALDTFSKNVGKAALGDKTLSAQFNAMHVDVKDGVLPALMQFANVIGNTTNATKANAAITALMGRSSVEMSGFLRQGSAAIKAQGDEFKSMGAIIEEEAIKKIDELGKKWETVKAQFTSAGANVLAGFATDFDKFAGGVESPAFQSSMKQFGADLAEVAKWIVQIGSSPLFKYLIAGGIGKAVGGIPGAIIGMAGTTIYENFKEAYNGKPVPQNADEAKAAMLAAQNDLEAARKAAQSSGKSFWQQDFGTVVGSAIRSFTPDSTIGQKLGGVLSVQTATQRRDASRNLYEYFQGREAKGNQPTSDLPKGPGVPDSMFKAQEPAKVSQYAKAVADLITKTKELGEAEDDSAAGTAKAEAASRLLDAAHSDGMKITPALTKQINDLAAAYAAVVAQRAWMKDLHDADAEIAKVGEEAKRASVAALAEAEEKAKLMADFHKEYGENAVPSVAQQSAIESRARHFGTNTGAAQFSKDVQSAQDENKALQQQTQTVGLYGGALAEATMRLTLLNQAMKDGQLLDEKTLANIDALAKAHGTLTKQLEDQQEAEQNRVQVTDELRNGLENLAMTGTTGFKNLGDAAKNFTVELMNLILKLYVMQPMLESLFGKSGTSGGGLLGPLLNDGLNALGGTLDTATAGDIDTTMVDNPAIFFGFARGGVMTPRGPMPLRTYSGGGIANSPQLAMFGEGSVPEAYVPVPSGRIPVKLSMPAMPSMPRAGGQMITVAPVINVDARYATKGVSEEVTSQLRTVAPVIMEGAVRRARAEFPDNMRKTMRDRG